MSIYEYMTFIHKAYFPHLRIGQFIYNFAFWFNKEYGRDIFYIEDNELTGLLDEYAKSVKKTH